MYYPENKDAHFITFESRTEYKKIKKKFINIPENELDGTEMKGVFIEL